MKKQSSDSAMKDHKNQGGSKTAANGKTGAGKQGNSHSGGASQSNTSSATSKAKPKTGHGMANEGTNVDYTEHDR